jgi:hypothetical protein
MATPSPRDEERLMPGAFTFGWYAFINLDAAQVGREGGREREGTEGRREA